MQKSVKSPSVRNQTLRFTLPVMLENTLSIFISLIFTRIISTISSSSLAAIGSANIVQTFLQSIFGTLWIGASVLVAREIGANQYGDAADIIEQAVFFGLISSVVMMVLTYLLAKPVLSLTMPNSEGALLTEAVRYYRVLMLSFPTFVLYTILSSAARSMGNSRSPMIVAIATNLSQILFGFLFIKLFSLEEIGAGLAYICCRFVGFVLIFIIMMREHRYFRLRIGNMFRPKLATFRRILHVGLPVGLENTFTNLGYLLANSMSIALGTMEASAYQIINTLNTFTSLPQGIVSTIGIPIVGRLIGAGKIRESKSEGLKLIFISVFANIALALLCWIFAKPLCSVYSNDPETIELSAGITWTLLVFNTFGCIINANDPQLRAAGDTRFVMFTTVSSVWLIRLPLTWLFCFRLHWGVTGIYMANAINLAIRSATGLVRHYCTDKWYLHKV